MMRKRKYKYLLLIGILLFISIGYALLSVDLGVSGMLNIDDGSWNVHFENYQETNNSTVSPTSGNAPVITGNTTTEISYAVQFNEPGELYEFTIDIVNGGTLDANVKALEAVLKDGDNVISNIPSYLDYSVTYSNGDEYVTPHGLAAAARETILVRVEFKRDILVAEYEEAAGKEFQFGLIIMSEQGKNTPPSEYYYLFTDTADFTFRIGDDITNYENVDLYDNYQAANSNVFLRHTMEGNKIKRTDIGYIYNGNVYYIPPYSTDDEDYDITVAYILDIFGLDYDCYHDPGYELNCGSILTYYQDDLLVRGDRISCSASYFSSACYD